jgi:hypothetical protein
MLAVIVAQGRESGWTGAGSPAKCTRSGPSSNAVMS